jgi:hypothetical protein
MRVVYVLPSYRGEEARPRVPTIGLGARFATDEPPTEGHRTRGAIPCARSTVVTS